MSALSIELQMSILLAVALGGYLLAARINQSSIIGIILAGIIVGPSGFGLITYTDFVSTFAHIGAIVLLFAVGMHFKFEDIANVKYLPIAAFGVILPWIGGFFLAYLFGFPVGPSIFIGTALTATSIAITANVFKEMGMLATDAAKAVIGAAVIDDVLSLVALSISKGIASGTVSTLPVMLLVLKAVIFIVSGVLLGKHTLRVVIHRIDCSRIALKYPEFVFIFALMCAFFYSVAAELIGLSAIIGSFLAGVVLEGVTTKCSKSFREGAEYLQIIFAALFFISLGVLVDVQVVDSTLVVFVLILSVVAILTKLLGCGIPALINRMALKDSLIVGFGMAPRGEVAMIIALIGLNAGLIGQPTYTSLVLMSIITTLFVPVILRNWLLRSPKKA